MLSPSFIPRSFLIYSTLRSAFSQSPQRKFYGIFLIKTMQKSSNLKTVQNILLFFSLHPVLWNKGLAVKRITFDRILLYWKVSMNTQGMLVEIWLTHQSLKTVPCAEEGIVVPHLHWERAGCHSSLLHGEWLCLLGTLLMRASGLWGSAVLAALQQRVCLRASLKHWALPLAWNMSEGSHVLVTSHRTGSWLLCCNTLLFSKYQFKHILCNVSHGCVWSLIPSQICPFPLVGPLADPIQATSFCKSILIPINFRECVSHETVDYRRKLQLAFCFSNTFITVVPDIFCSLHKSLNLFQNLRV